MRKTPMDRIDAELSMRAQYDFPLVGPSRRWARRLG
jgi:DNA-binding Lrp family transcriptional regulator